MAQSVILLGLVILVKHIVFHLGVILLIFVVFFVVAIIGLVIQHGGDQSSNRVFLLLVQGGKHVAKGLFIVLGFGFGLTVFVLFLVGMLQLDAGAGKEHAFVVGQFTKLIPMLNHVGNARRRVCAGKHQAHFANHPMAYVGTILLQPVGKNGQALHIAVLHQLLGKLTVLGVVEGAVGKYAVFHVLKKRMPQNVKGVIMLVVPHKGNGLSVIILEGIPHNDPAI